MQLGTARMIAVESIGANAYRLGTVGHKYDEGEKPKKAREIIIESSEVIKQIVRDGGTTKTIAEYMGINQSTVQLYIREAIDNSHMAIMKENTGKAISAGRRAQAKGRIREVRPKGEVVVKPPTMRELMTRDKELVLSMISTGATCKDIANYYGVHSQTVFKKSKEVLGEIAYINLKKNAKAKTQKGIAKANEKKKQLAKAGNDG